MVSSCGGRVSFTCNKKHTSVKTLNKKITRSYTLNTLIEARQTELVLVKVGDIIKDNIHNTYHMVESNGFSELVTFGREPRGLDINI